MRFDRPQRTDHGISERWNEAQRRANPPVCPDPALAQALEHPGPPRRSLWRRLFHTREDQMTAWVDAAARANALWVEHFFGCDKCKKGPAILCHNGGWNLQMNARALAQTVSMKLGAGGRWGWPNE